jgi:D-alanine-D-alanine ligase
MIVESSASDTRVLLLYNEPVLPLDHPDAESEHEILYTVEAVEQALAGAGFTARRLGVGRDPEVLISGLRSERPDVVFNLFEGLADDNGT